MTAPPSLSFTTIVTEGGSSQGLMLMSARYWLRKVQWSRLHPLSTSHVPSLLARPWRDWQVERGEEEGPVVGGALVGQALGGRSELHCEWSMGMEVSGMMVVLPSRSYKDKSTTIIYINVSIAKSRIFSTWRAYFTYED